jgi:hypothetical protein
VLRKTEIEALLGLLQDKVHEIVEAKRKADLRSRWADGSFVFVEVWKVLDVGLAGIGQMCVGYRGIKFVRGHVGYSYFLPWSVHCRRSLAVSVWYGGS